MNAILHSRSLGAFHFALQSLTGAARMELDPRGKPLRLKDGQVVRLRHAQGMTIKSVTGSLWITQNGDPRDIVLETGESFVVDRSGVVLLSPIVDAEVCIRQSRFTL
ncbi:MAG: hypothetical protein JWQ23_2983 [Herminiimonas sp.]|nr:hypothetical protein [Herminiimonas sp.]